MKKRGFDAPRSRSVGRTGMGGYEDSDCRAYSSTRETNRPRIGEQLAQQNTITFIGRATTATPVRRIVAMGLRQHLGEDHAITVSRRWRRARSNFADNRAVKCRFASADQLDIGMLLTSSKRADLSARALSRTGWKRHRLRVPCRQSSMLAPTRRSAPVRWPEKNPHHRQAMTMETWQASQE